MKIAVAGTGYVSLSIATLLSKRHQVIAQDILPAKIDLINCKQSPIQDVEIQIYQSNKTLNLRATLNKKDAYIKANFITIATPTYYDPQSQHINTTSVEAVIKDVI